MKQNVLVIGASPNETRYSNQAVKMFQAKAYNVLPLGIRGGRIGDLEIILDRDSIKDVDLISLYVGPINQSSWIPYIIGLKPKRVIFNPGTENEALTRQLDENNIPYEFACSLVLLSTGQL